MARWAKDIHEKSRLSGHSGQDRHNKRPTLSIVSTYPEIAANGALALIAVAIALLDRKLATQAKAFEKEGGFTERLYRKRREQREND